MKLAPFCTNCHRLMLGLRSNPAKLQPSITSQAVAAPGNCSQKAARGRGRGRSRSVSFSKPRRKLKKLPNGEEASEASGTQTSMASESRTCPGSVRALPLVQWLAGVRAEKRQRVLELAASAGQKASASVADGPKHRRDVVAVGRAEWQKMRGNLSDLDGQRLGRLGRSQTQGWGLFAARDIRAGELVAEYIGMVCSLPCR
jgi:hypothetical protein